MDNDQLTAAKREIDVAETQDAHSYAVLAAKGRYLLRMGRPAEGEKALLEASAVNPTYGDALIGLAIASYQQDANDETMQALDNADRFDRKNPSVPLIRAGIALDQFRADEAIYDAREALRRRLERGGYYSGYDANRQASSYLGVALENVGLDEWGQYYSDRAYDPFKSTSYIDEAAKGRSSPFIDVAPTVLDRSSSGATSPSSQLQGLLLDPLSVSSEVRRNSLERRSFFETALGGSVLDEGNGPNLGANILLQGTSYSTVPVSYYIQGESSRSKGLRDNDADDLDGGLFQLGLRPTLFDSVVLFGNKYRQFQGFPEPLFAPSDIPNMQTEGATLGGAWSHAIEDRNVVQMFAVSSDTETHQQFASDDNGRHFGFALRDLNPENWRPSNGLTSRVTANDGLVDQTASDRYFAFGLNHILGIGPVTVKYGTEATLFGSKVSQVLTPFDGSEAEYIGPFRDKTLATRSYIDATYEASLDLKFEAGAFYTRIDGDGGKWGPIDPRLGAAWSPVDGHWLRAHYRQDTQMPSNYTLSPISIVGLMPMELPTYWFRQTQTAALRWDAEWSNRFFTSVEYQHMRFSGLALSALDVFAYDYFRTSDGEIDRLNFSGNYWTGNGLGAFASMTLYRSRDLSPNWNSSLAVPLIPDYIGQVGLQYVSQSRVTATIAQNLVGQRIGALTDGPTVFQLGRYATTDVALGWTSNNRSLDWTLSVTNIFDQHIESAYDVPAPGRTIKGTFTARF
jgi:tetratricopeptide (TPR) repeat protein